jgi:nitrous oxidase accessory protein NosD
VCAGTLIQTAIDGAGERDTSYVHAGTYVENVDVWKQVTLIGDGADVVTVRAADVGDHVFNVTMDWVNIRGFTVTGVMIEYYRCKAGIYLNGVNHCNIFENNASKNCYGIHLGIRVTTRSQITSPRTTAMASICGIRTTTH